MVLASTSIVPPSVDVVPPSSSEPGCQLASTEPGMLTASAGTEPAGLPMTRSAALISTVAGSPPLAAAVRTWPAISSDEVTAIDSSPASAGSAGRGLPALLAAALKYVDAGLRLYSASCCP